MKRWFSRCAVGVLQASLALTSVGCTGVLGGDGDGVGAPLGADGTPLEPYINAAGVVVDGVFVREDGVLVDVNGQPIKVDPVTGEPIIGQDGKPIVDPNPPGPPGTGLGENWVAAAFADTVPVSPTRRLTISQYKTSVTEAFGVDVMLPELPANETATLEHDPEASPLGDYETYVLAATELGKQIAPTLVERCNFQANTASCTDSEIVPALGMLYRFEVGADEAGTISGAISEAITRTGDTVHGVAHGIARALIEPSFLYRMEEGQGAAKDDGGFALKPFEMASRISFFASDAPPMEGLFSSAATGGLSSEDGLQTEVDAAFSTEQFREITWNFMSKMLGLADGANETDPLKLAMVEETRRFVEHILVDEQGEFSDLFSASYSFINAELAHHYGVPAPATDWELYEFPESSRRRGILTHASFLSAHGRHEPDRSWIFRGKAVYENLFCGKLPPPPEGVVDVEPKGSRTEDPGCRGCHLLMDPAGQFFANFDAEGALINSDATPGDFKAGSDIDVPFGDLPEFLNAVSTSRAAKHCFVKHWFGEALGRPLTAYDNLSFELSLAVMQDEGSLRDLLRQIATTASFQTYYPKPSEQICQ